MRASAYTALRCALVGRGLQVSLSRAQVDVRDERTKLEQAQVRTRLPAYAHTHVLLVFPAEEMEEVLLAPAMIVLLGEEAGRRTQAIQCLCPWAGDIRLQPA